MKKISGSDLGEIQLYQQQLVDANEQIEKAIKQYNKVAEPLYQAMDDLIQKQRARVAEYNELLQAQIELIEKYYNDQPQDWRMGPEGDKYRKWMQSFHDGELDEDYPENVEDWRDIEVEPHTAELPDEELQTQL